MNKKATNFLIFALTLLSSTSHAIEIDCQLRVTRGDTGLCEWRKDFCRRTFSIDTKKRTVIELPQTSESRASKQVIESWSNEVIRFSHWTMKSGNFDNPDFIIHRVMELNRITGAIEVHGEYRDKDGKPMTDEYVDKLRRQDPGPGLPYPRQNRLEGTCTVVNRLL